MADWSVGHALGASAFDVADLTVPQKDRALRVLGLADFLAGLHAAQQEKVWRLEREGGNPPRPAAAGRPHQTIVLAGQRGTGKTSLLLTIRRLLEVLSWSGRGEFHKLAEDLHLPANWGQQAPKWGHAVVLPTIFPALREADTGLMEEIFGAIQNSLNEQAGRGACAPVRSSDKDGETADRLILALRTVWSGWVFGCDPGAAVLGRDSADFPDYVEQRIDVASNACLRQDNWFRFVSDFLDARRCHLLVVCIDDSDLKPGVAIEVAETIHQYLGHPRILTILAADLEEYRQHLWNYELGEQRDEMESMSRIVRSLHEAKQPRAAVLADDIDRRLRSIDQQTQEFLRKIMPPPMRFDLPQGLDNQDIRRILGLRTDDPDQSGDCAAAAPLDGRRGRWLLVNRHARLLRDMRLRQLNQFKLWLRLNDQDIASGYWHPRAALDSFFDDAETHRIFLQFLSVLQGDSLARLGLEASSLRWGLDSSGRRLPSPKHDGVLGAAADFLALRTGWSLRNACECHDLADAVTRNLAAAFQGGTSPLSEALPANAWYYADLAAIARMPLQSQQSRTAPVTPLTRAVIVDDMLPKRMNRFVTVLAESAPDNDRLVGACFNAWLYFFHRDDVLAGTPVLRGMARSFLHKAAAYQRSRQADPSFLAYVEFLARLSLEGAQLEQGLHKEETGQLSLALQVALAPAAEGRLDSLRGRIGEGELSQLLDILGRVVRGWGDVRDRASWRDRLMLALAALDPLRKLGGLILSEDEAMIWERTIEDIKAFLAAPPDRAPASAFDLITVLDADDDGRGWQHVVERMEGLRADYESCSRRSFDMTEPEGDDEAHWLGVVPAAVRKLRDDYFPR